MNKKIELRKNTLLLFFINIIILISMFAFKKIYGSLDYPRFWINITFIIDIIVLFVGIFFNILFLFMPNLFNEKKSNLLIIITFIIYIAFNIGGNAISNKIVFNKYFKVTNQILKYCENFGCRRYETKPEGKYYDFIIRDTYIDYNNNEKEYEIHNIYDDKKIIKITAIVYSDNESFSQELIKKVLEDYLDNFSVQVNAGKIQEAFENRFLGKETIEKNITYKVTEIYKNKQLDGLKTEIKINISE